MQLTDMTIKNFKALREINVPLSRLVCVIGENNAGKSSLMQALLRFIEGGKLDSSFYFDPGQEIAIKVKIEGITADNLSLITSPEHRSRFAGILRNHAVTLVRRYTLDGTSKLRWISRVPTEQRFDPAVIDKLLEGKRPSAQFAQELTLLFPEIAGKADAKTNQGQARELIREIADGIPDDKKRDEESDLPSGIDNSIRPFLPEPIYIPGVKDLSDDMKTKDSASFGKLLSILLNEVTPDLANAEEAFSFLNKSLNRIVDDKGSMSDEKFAAVKEIEATVERYVQTNFPQVRLDVHIPPPEIKTILGSAEVWADDGVKGPITTKGDGLKRAVTFAIFRAYVELKRRENQAGKSTASPSYLFLFKEPELFLHPVAQRVLFDALDQISALNHVVVSTHSPLFFQASSASTFIKMLKRTDPAIDPKPFSVALAIDVTKLDRKAQFQLITYETTNAAFFCKAVTLVEGDSDYLVLPHLAKILNPDWNAERAGLAFCRVSGKGNVGRYRQFFQAFEIVVSVIADLDCLIEGFELLDASEPCKTVRERLIQQIDAYIAKNDVSGKLSSRDLRDLRESGQRREQWEAICRTYQKCLSGEATEEELRAAGGAFFEDEANKKRRAVLQMSSVADVATTKRELLRLLRQEGICLLEKGAIESYYPPQVTGPDKPSKALAFCQQIDTREKALSLCEQIPVPMGDAKNEFELIFEQVFSTSAP